MNIVWFSWKDSTHPQAGGAELVSDHIRQRLVQDGHHVTLITAQYPGSKPIEMVKGVQTIRAGGRFSVYVKARRAYRLLRPSQDVVIDEMNTVPFMVAFYRTSARPVLLTYQLARKVWFYQMPFPISVIGYILEPLYLRIISKRYQTVLTESNSTKQDLVRFGFSANSIGVFRVGMETNHPHHLTAKPNTNHIVFLGSLRPMKRPLDAIKAFEFARDTRPQLSLSLAGSTSGPYAKKVIAYAEHSRHASAITVMGHISDSQKSKLLQAAGLILVTSVKEGWGLIVTEANSQGTPAIVYDTDGLRDSVIGGKTGLVTPSGDSKQMGKAIVDLLGDRVLYDRFRKAAFENSAQFTFDNSYQDFMRLTKIKPETRA